MSDPERVSALAVLRHLLEGGRIDGIRFGPVLQVLVAPGDGKEPIAGQVYINLVSRWAVFDALTTPRPECEDDIPERGIEESLQVLCSLRDTEIARVELGAESPHLMVLLKDGRMLFVNGNHDMQETWHCGVAMGAKNESWLVVASPGGGLATWAPTTFPPAWPTV